MPCEKNISPPSFLHPVRFPHIEEKSNNYPSLPCPKHLTGKKRIVSLRKYPPLLSSVISLICIPRVKTRVSKAPTKANRYFHPSFLKHSTKSSDSDEIMGIGRVAASGRKFSAKQRSYQLFFPLIRKCNVSFVFVAADNNMIHRRYTMTKLFSCIAVSSSRSRGDPWMQRFRS